VLTASAAAAAPQLICCINGDTLAELVAVEQAPETAATVAAAAAAEKAGAEVAGAARAAAAQTNPVVTNPAAAESWAFLDAILQSRPAVSIPRLMCGTLRGSARGVTAGSEMAAAVADDTHRFCHRCDQLIASLEAIDQDVLVEPAAAQP
jgi:hypothetical protein